MIYFAQVLVFTVLLVKSVFDAKKLTKNGLRAKMFLKVDPVIKAFYLFFIGTTLSYLLLLLYFLDEQFYGLFVVGEVTLGMSIIGLAYLVSYFFRGGKIG